MVTFSSALNTGVVDLDRFSPASGRVLTEDEKAKKSFVPTGYSDSKLMSALFAKELGKRLAGAPVVVFLVLLLCGVMFLA